MGMHMVAIALGGNQGDVRGSFDRAVELLSSEVHGIRRAGIRVTSPVDCVPGTPDFLNSALAGEYGGSPMELLELCQGIERSLGRPEVHSSREGRPIDLDILLFGGLAMATPRLVIPHPRMHLRRFVLEPLCEILPDAMVPGQGRTVSELLEVLDSK